MVSSWTFINPLYLSTLMRPPTASLRHAEIILKTDHENDLTEWWSDYIQTDASRMLQKWVALLPQDSEVKLWGSNDRQLAHPYSQGILQSSTEYHHQISPICLTLRTCTVEKHSHHSLPANVRKVINVSIHTIQY